MWIVARGSGQPVRETQANSNGDVVVDCCQRFGQRNLGQSLSDALVDCLLTGVSFDLAPERRGRLERGLVLGFYWHWFTVAAGPTGTGIGQTLASSSSWIKASTGAVDAGQLVERWAESWYEMPPGRIVHSLD